jgi:preprotein translocase subunit SecE
MVIIMDKFIQYLKDVRSEMAKVSWPTRNEVSSATVLVVVLSIIVSLFVYACDLTLNKLVGLFLKTGM